MFRQGHTFGHYRIESVLGEGGMGIVYEATDLKSGRSVALKVVNPDRARDVDGNGGIEAARRLVREGRSAASLRHPNAIAVLDAGEFDGTPYIAMELARGRALGQFIGDTRIPTDQRIEWLLAMARGLAAAHTSGLVHRDVKPENVMVCDDGAVKLFDFGVAKPFADSRAPIDSTVVTHTGVVLGTPLYMAPEQVLGEKVDPRSDQYAWATVAYELLSTGTHPVATTEERNMPVPFAILKGVPKSLGEVAPAVPPRIVKVVMRALSKERAARYPHMDRVVEALEAYVREALEHDPATAGPWPASETLTVAVRPPLVSDEDEGNETVTQYWQRDPASPDAPARATLSERPPRSRNPVSFAPPPQSADDAVRSSSPPRSPRVPSPVSSGPALSRPVASSRRGIEDRADPAILGPISQPIPFNGARPSSGPLSSPFVSVSMGEASVSADIGPASRSSNDVSIEPKSETPRRVLWLLIVLVSILAGVWAYRVFSAH